MLLFMALARCVRTWPADQFPRVRTSLLLANRPTPARMSSRELRCSRRRSPTLRVSIVVDMATPFDSEVSHGKVHLQGFSSRFPAVLLWGLSQTDPARMLWSFRPEEIVKQSASARFWPLPGASVGARRHPKKETQTQREERHSHVEIQSEDHAETAADPEQVAAAPEKDQEGGEGGVKR